MRQRDLRLFADILTVDLILKAAHKVGLRLCASPLNCINLVWLSINAALFPLKNFSGILESTLNVLRAHEAFHHSDLAKRQRRQRNKRQAQRSGPHDPRASDPATVTEEAFVKARRRLPPEFWLALLLLLVERFEQQQRQRLCWRNFRLLAIDGTRLNVPDVQALRTHFGTANNGTGPHRAQARMVLLQFPLTRLPYRYQLTPLAEGETTVARRLVKYLHAGDLLLMDALFCSYGLFWDIQHQEAFFLVRQSRKLNLRRQGRLAEDDALVEWTPKDSRGQWRKEGLPKSMMLRQLTFRRRGYRTLRLLTNVLEAALLPWAEVSALVHDGRTGQRWLSGLYHRRWEIETTYWELKVGQQMDRRLRSRSVGGIQYEVGGHVLLYFLLRWLIVQAALAGGLEPLRLSFLEALRELSELRSLLLISSDSWVAQHLKPQLLERIISHEVPERRGRKYPRKKKKQSKPKKS